MNDNPNDDAREPAEAREPKTSSKTPRAKANPAAKPKAAAKAEPKAASKPKAASGPKAKGAPEAEPAAKAAPKKAAPKKAKAKAEPVSESEPEAAKAGAKAGAKATKAAESAVEAKSKATSKAKPKAESPMAEAEPETKAASRAKTVSKVKPEPKVSAEAEPRRKTAPAASDEAEAAPAEAWAPATDANTGTRDPAKAVAPRTAKKQGGDAPLRRRAAPPARSEAVIPAVTPPGAAPAQADEAPAETHEGERIAKAIARAGIASRRDAEAMIAEGRVSLNGRVLASPAVNVTEDDVITVDGEPLPARERTRLWIFHKPRGLVTTARDPEGRQTVFEALPDDLPRVVAVGRLDINTEGLLLLTNDGGLAKVIAHPDTGWLRRYRVRAHGDTNQAELDKLRKGVTIDGMEYGPVEANLDRVQGDNLWLTLGLREGKNREVKRILEHLGLSVNRLIRLSFGPFQLGDLEAGLVDEIRTKVLKEQLGPSLAAQAGVDFESPV
ncbi:pseudouridine synthase, partial [Methylobacterium soli]|uniref:pseudouridine synthase n=1 Tax=Methylobacterium soli TaxID=553447 RepID=UPI001EE39A2F